MKLAVRCMIIMSTLLAISLPLIAQSETVIINCDGKTQDDIVSDLLLDAELYDGKQIELQGLIYEKFGLEIHPVTFLKCNPWFEDRETFGILPTKKMFASDFQYWFHPSKSDRGARKWAMDIAGKMYRGPQIVSIRGTFRIQPKYIGMVYLFIVDRIIVGKDTFLGDPPPSITK